MWRVDIVRTLSSPTETSWYGQNEKAAIAAETRARLENATYALAWFDAAVTG